jgi:hypothetical protein
LALTSKKAQRKHKVFGICFLRVLHRNKNKQRIDRWMDIWFAAVKLELHTHLCYGPGCWFVWEYSITIHNQRIFPLFIDERIETGKNIFQRFFCDFTRKWMGITWPCVYVPHQSEKSSTDEDEHFFLGGIFDLRRSWSARKNSERFEHLNLFLFSFFFPIAD